MDELYYVAALKNLDDFENIQDSEAGITELDNLSDKYGALLHFKEFYYKEMQKSIKMLNRYLEKGEARKIGLDMGKLIYNIGNYFWIYPYYLDLDIFIHEFHSPKLFKKLVNAILDIQVYAYENKININNIESVELWLNFFSVFRETEFEAKGQILWILFLISLGNYICACEEYNKFLEIDFNNDWLQQLNQMISQTSILVEGELTQRLVNRQRDMLFFYVQQPMKSDVFDIKVEKLVMALKKQEEIFKYYIGKKQKGCIAMMHFQSKQYVALSGTNGVNCYKEILEQLLGPGYEFVGLNENVRFYYNKNSYITYKQYVEWKCKNNVDEKQIDGIRRMFSCCERKLLTKLYEKTNLRYTIYVKLKPCTMCKKAIEDLENRSSCNGLIKYPKNIRKYKEATRLTTKLNEVAKCIRDDTIPGR